MTSPPPIDPEISGPIWLPTLPPSLETYLAPTLQPIPLLPALALALLVLYLVCAVRLWTSGRRWPLLPSLSFVAGCLILAVITGAGVEGYGFRLFSVFMFQQLTLMMVVPPLLVLGRPGTLILRAAPHNALGRAIMAGMRWSLRSRVTRTVLHPAFTVPLFLLTFYGLYLSDFASTVLATWAGHTALEFGFLTAGILFTIPILSRDPTPMHLSEGARALDLFAEMPLHAFFGVIIMMSVTPVVSVFSSPPASWQIDPARDQWLAGALAWSYGEAPSLLILLIIMFRWRRSDEREAVVRESEIDRDGDRQLDDYNQFLDSLRQREISERAPRGHSRFP